MPSGTRRPRPPKKDLVNRRMLTDVLVMLIRVAGELVREWIEKGGRF